ncbi:MAG: hypothetical protein ACQEP4_05220 [Bacillota bacterium]
MRIQFHTDTVKKSNEDIYGLTKKGAFVIDGASALSERSFTPDGNDVSWMVQWWRDYLDKNLDDTTHTIQDILKEGIESFNREYGKFVDIKSLLPHEQLSAAIAIIRKNGNTLESYVLGDVEISVENKSGECSIVTDSALKGLDAEVVELMGRNHQRQEHLVFKGFTEEELEILIRNRMKMNTPGGYFILGHSTEAAEMGIYKTFQIDEIEKCLLSTDGIVPLNCKYSRSNLLDRIRSNGVREIVRELRGLEESDSEKRTIGRLKTHDDVTVVYLDFGLQS